MSSNNNLDADTNNSSSNINNPPPSKLLRSKLASVSSTSSKRAKNTKNLFLNVKQQPHPHRPDIDGSLQRQKSQHRLRGNSSLNTANIIMEPPQTPFVSTEFRSKSRSTTPPSQLLSPTNPNSHNTTVTSSPPSYFNSSGSPSPLQSPQRSTSLGSRALPPLITNANSPTRLDKRRPSTGLSISIPSNDQSSFISNNTENLMSPTTNTNNNTSMRTFSTTLVMPPHRPLSPHERMDMDKDVLDAYPDGPVLVCAPNVYLYSEPSLDVAYKFDVVINVAREVVNPFAQPVSLPTHQESQEAASQHQQEHQQHQRSSACSSPTEISTVNTNPSIVTSSLSSPPSSVESTPDLSVSPSKPPGWNKEPEYIYVPWDHNSKLVSELGYLTDLIEARSAQGKSILIHCQCGVSRSASLVVAYVMKKFEWDLNTAYNHVKERSPSISPNMTLMFQLIDWQRMIRDSSSTTTLSSPSRRSSPAASIVV